MRKEQKRDEWFVGIVLGLILAILFSIKVLAAPVTEEEVEMMAKIVELESGNQCLEGRRAVCAVILNRCDSEEFPNTINEVISEPGQFTTYKHIDEVTPSWQSQLATKLELEGRSDREIVFFRAGHYGMGKPAYQIQDHYFSSLKK